jgi:hypothetical protein
MPTYQQNDPKGWCGDPSRGAALGRSTIDQPDEDTFTEPLTLKRVPLDRGGYDPNGTYFGTGESLYWLASHDGNIDLMFRAVNGMAARHHAEKLYPNAVLPDEIVGLDIEVGDVELDEFTQGYVACALWVGVHDEEGETVDGYEVEDVEPETLLAMKRECADFQEANDELLEQYYNHHTREYAGHDFFLTRNGHGAGFWDRGLGDVGKELSDAARVYGDYDLYVDDDGKVRAG